MPTVAQTVPLRPFRTTTYAQDKIHITARPADLDDRASIPHMQPPLDPFGKAHICRGCADSDEYGASDRADYSLLLATVGGAPTHASWRRSRAKSTQVSGPANRQAEDTSLLRLPER